MTLQASNAAHLLFREGRTAYAFTNKPVTEDQLEEIYELTRHAPTAMNSQPLRVVYLRSAEAKARLIPLLGERNRPKSESAPVVAILAADTNFHENLPHLLPSSPNAKDGFADDVKRVQAAMFNASLQAGYFILAARAVGLDVGPMGGFDKAAVDEEFFPGTAVRSLLVVNLGYVAEGGNFPRKPHVPYDNAVTIL